MKKTIIMFTSLLLLLTAIPMYTLSASSTQFKGVLSVGLGSSDLDFGIAMGGNYDLKGYEKIYDTFATALFEGKASDFKKAFEAKLAERKKNGTFKPVTFILNGLRFE